MIKKAVFAALASAVLFAAPAQAAGDAAAGEKVFNQCKACHEVEKGVNKVGPTLKGVVGRKAASVEGYKYSAAMTAKGAEGVVWDEATLDKYLTNPRAAVPGTKMSFAGIADAAKRKELITWLMAQK